MDYPFNPNSKLFSKFLGELATWQASFITLFYRGLASNKEVIYSLVKMKNKS